MAPDKGLLCGFDPNNCFGKCSFMGLITWSQGHGARLDSGFYSVFNPSDAFNHFGAPVMIQFKDSRADGVVLFFKIFQLRLYVTYVGAEHLKDLFSSKKKTIEDAEYFKTLPLTHEAIGGFGGKPSNQAGAAIESWVDCYLGKSPWAKSLNIKKVGDFGKFIQTPYVKKVELCTANALLESRTSARQDHAPSDLSGMEAAAN